MGRPTSPTRRRSSAQLAPWMRLSSPTKRSRGVEIGAHPAAQQPALSYEGLDSIRKCCPCPVRRDASGYRLIG